MMKYPFHPDELKVCSVSATQDPFAPPPPLYSPPITPAENLRRLLRGETPLWMADHDSIRFFNPRLIPDNVARGMVVDCAPFDMSQAGGRDWFGVEWVYDPAAGGSMPVDPPLVSDLENWESQIRFPDLDSLDWVGCAEENKALLCNDYFICNWVFTGLFERLVSFVGMEEALVALIDEDEQEAVHRLFDRLCEFYADLFAHMKQYFGTELIFFHDDWGSQNAPLFSRDTVEEMLLPYLKRIIQSAHDLGCWVEFHSCGKIDLLVPAIVASGADLWDGQTLNDFAVHHRQFGDRFHFEPYAPELSKEATAEEISDAARAYVDTYCPNALCNTRQIATPQLQAEFLRYVYEYSRIALWGRAE